MEFSPASSFVGRERELAQLDLRAERDGVVVLVGLGGVGKSRLAARYCAEALWVELADVADPAGVSARVAAALGLPPGRSSTLALAAELGAGATHTLVLDAADGVIEHAHAMALVWREALPELRVLLTSRVAGGLPASVLMPVRPLSTAEGCALFRDRAAAAGTPVESEGDLEELVATLDGLPLSIELLASRVRLLGFAELMARARMDVDGEARLPTSLEQVLRFSLELLDEEEREVLRVSSAFAGGFTVVDLEQVAGRARVLSGEDTLEAVERLVRHSLLVAATGAADPPRFRLLRAARALVLRDLPPDEAILRSHMRHFASRAEAVPAAWEGVDEDTNEVLRLDHEDLLLATQRALRSEPALCIAASIGAARWAWLGGSCARPLDALEQSLGVTEGSTQARGRAHLWAAALAQSRGDTGRAEEHVLHAQEMAVELGDRCLMGAAAMRLGGLRYASRALEEARPLLEEGVRLLSGTAARYQRALGMADLGMLRQEMGDGEAARALLSEARVDALPWPRLQAVVLQAWANQRLEAGDLPAAREALEESRALAMEQHASRFAIRADVDLGVTYHLAGDLVRAETLLTRAEGAATRAGFVRVAARARGLLAAVLLELGQFAAARSAARLAVDQADQGGDRRASAAFQLVWLAAAFAEGDADCAAVISSRLSAAVSTSEDPVMSSLAELARDWSAAVNLAPANQDRGTETLKSALLYRVVAQSLGAVTRALGFEGASEGPCGLVLESQGQAYSVDGGPQRQPACNGRRLLLALARARLDRPGEFVPSAELIAATWPGEALLGRSGSNRLHVELSKLRSSGLRVHLEREGAGYRLSPELRLRIVPVGVLD